jgi:SAM-dependent methyltransferase
VGREWDREAFDPETVRVAYDTVAADYVAAFGDDLDQLPVDRSVLDEAVGLRHGDGPIVDLGCGPGQVARYLADRGAHSIGVDLSPQMLRQARLQAASQPFVCGDLRTLPFRPAWASGAVAFYSIQHLPRQDLPLALEEIRRVVAPGGILVIATHLGQGEVYVPELLGHPLRPMGGTMYGDDELQGMVERHHFGVEQVRHREPLPHEYASSRVYLTARRLED